MRYKLNPDVIDSKEVPIEHLDLISYLKDAGILIPIGDNPTTDKEEWEEELRERSFAYKSGFVSENDFGNLVGFIRNLLQKSRKDWLQEEIERLEESKPASPNTLVPDESPIIHAIREGEYKALSDIQDYYQKELNQK